MLNGSIFNATFNTYSITTRRGFHWWKLDIFLLWHILRLLFQTRWSSCLQWWFFLSVPRETRLPPLHWEVSASFKLVWLWMCTFIWLIECCLNDAVSSNKAISQTLIQKQLILGTSTCLLSESTYCLLNFIFTTICQTECETKTPIILIIMFEH